MYIHSRNIHEFCRVLKQLPSLEGAQLNKGSNEAQKRETRSKPGSSAGTSDGAIMTEELRKVLVALNSNVREGAVGDGGERLPAKTAVRKAISPEALFHVIWKVITLLIRNTTFLLPCNGCISIFV